MSRIRIAISALLVAFMAVAAATAATASSKATNLNFVVYSTPRPVMDRLIAEFKKTPEGADISITPSYGGSSAQAAAVVAGLPADGVLLSTGVDMNLLVDNKIISPRWDKQSYGGAVWNSVVVFGLRDGNPKKIKSWNDLLKPGVEIVTPNPFTAGIAKWNILGAYVAQRRLGRTDAQAIDFLRKLYKNVVSQDSSGSNATNTFISGKGDVLLTFESEAFNGKIPFVIPRQTMSIEIYGAVTEKSEHKSEVNAFLRYLKSYPAQVILAENGYRPINKQALERFRKKYPVRPGETKITNPAIGGWRVADKKFFDPGKSVMQEIEESLGVSSG
jgi:sulfate transport system substrate-binding protein